MSIRQPLVIYFATFVLFWLVVRYLVILPIGSLWSTLAVLVIAVLSWGLAGKGRLISSWQAALVGLVVAEVYFALTFWSTPARNVALVLLVTVFFFDQWFDKMELTWIIVFILVLLGALLLVPFQAL